MTTIAFLGLGRMGAPMASRLANAGWDVVLYNRTQSRASELADSVGAMWAATPREAVQSADIVITMMADAPSLMKIYEGAEGVLAALRPGTVAIDMGTSGPEAVAELSRLVSEHGGSLIDAPVSGSTAAATGGTLTIMAGGSDEALDVATPVFEAISKKVYRLGPTGAGSAMKLAVNAVIFALGNAISESLVLAERAGIRREDAYDVFENSAVAAPMVAYRHDAFIDPEGTPAAFAMSLAAKDLRLIADLARATGAPMPQASVNLEIMEDAIRAGHAEDDMAAVAVFLRSIAGGPSD